jgi:Ca2+-binding RTX toxin-like protein
MTATCTNPYGTGINVSLEAGDDTLRVSSPTRVYARGGDGSDRLTAGSGNDALGDQGGNDRMSGRQGNDTLVPGRGHDSAFGGAGDDYLLLHNGDRDRRIDCGRGNDHAVIDRRLDPPPLDCEHVSYSR